MMSSFFLSYRRAEVRALWIVVVTAVGAGAGTLAYALGAQWWWAFGLGAGLALLFPRAFRRDWFEVGVRTWNKTIGALARVLSAITIRLCFYVVIFTEGRAGSGLRLAPPREGGSMWSPCESQSSQLEFLDENGPGGAGWLRDLVSAARRPGNGWMLLLIPFLFTLMLLGDEEEDTTPPTSTYTLY